MSELLLELRKDHNDILNSFLMIRKCSTAAEMHKVIFSLKTQLFEHLVKEDKCLYTHLLISAEKDEKLKEILTLFFSHIKEASALTVKFFTKNEILEDEDDFLDDLEKLISRLVARIDNEESIIFKEYEKRFDEVNLTMTKLIKHFKDEHKKLLCEISSLKKCDKTVDKYKKIQSLKKPIFEHLEVENENLYTPTLAGAERDNDLKVMLDKFNSHFNKITTFAINFYKKNEVLKNEAEFLHDLHKFIVLILVRIKSEEKILFAEYEKRFSC
ncbi:MAG: hypothetical protein GY756_04375 [bacterium]|nr:hypothetical protein [bacterium]